MLSIGAFTLGITGVAAAQKDGVKIEPAGVMVVGKTEGENFRGLLPFNSELGTRVSMMVTVPKGLVEIHADDSKLTSLTDDRSKSLIVKREFGSDGIQGFPRINDEGTAGLFEITAGGVPAPGTKQLKAKGALTVSLATKSETVKSAKISFQQGAKIKVGTYEFVVSKVGKPQFSEGVQEITLKIEEPLTKVRNFHFLDASGKEIESSPSGSSSMGFNDNVTIEKTFTLEKTALQEGFLELDVWQDLKQVTVPFDAVIGLGFDS